MTGVRFLLTMAAAATIAGLLVLKADATPLTSAPSPLAAGGHSPVERIGCMFGTRRCPAGTKWSCTHYSGASGTAKKCVCRSC